MIMQMADTYALYLKNTWYHLRNTWYDLRNTWYDLRNTWYDLRLGFPTYYPITIEDDAASINHTYFSSI